MGRTLITRRTDTKWSTERGAVQLSIGKRAWKSKNKASMGEWVKQGSNRTELSSTSGNGLCSAVDLFGVFDII